MKRAAWIIAMSLFGAATGTPAAPQIPDAVVENRDLRAYEDGGVYRGFDHIDNVDRLRDFIWTHWTQKRRGYVEVVFQGMDARTQTYLFIEPINDLWGIAWCDIPYSAFLPSAPCPRLR